MRLKKIIIPILIILFILSALIIGYLKVTKNDIQEDNSEVFFTPEDIISLLSYIPYSSIHTNGYKDAYDGELVMFEDVYSTILFPTFIGGHVDKYTQKENSKNNNQNDLLSMFNIEYTGIYLKSSIDNFFKKNYNYEFSDIEKINDKVEIVDIDKKYISINHNLNNGFSSFLKSVIAITKSKATKSSAIIEEKAVFYALKNDKYYVYSTTNKEPVIIKIYDKIDENVNALSLGYIDSKIREDFGDYNYVFRHTFKKNKTGYYWYSTELVEED